MNREVLVLGDSHANVFKDLVIRRLFWKYSFNVVAVGGATASGLENPNSKTDAYDIFQKALEDEKPKFVLTMLGEVDTGFVIWYRAQKKEITVTESLEKTVRTYSNFISNIKSKRVVFSAPLPTIRDGQMWGEVANFRKEINASQIDRTKLTREFNSKIQQFCRKNSIPFVNLDRHVLDSTGILKTMYYSKDSNDHHYDLAAFKKLIIRKIPLSIQ